MKPLSVIVDALKREDLVVSAPDESPSLSGITDDTRQLSRGNLYVAVRGIQEDGHRFARDAVAKGASALLVETIQHAGVPEVVVTDGRRAASAAARAWYERPADRLILIAVTGTNGKTTTTALTRHLLNSAGDAGSIGTLGAFDGAGEPIPSTAGSLTTPGPVDLQATLARMLERGVRRAVMEASSHSLDQRRLDDLTFAAGIFTNLTQDHLDYHGTMEEYLAAKLRLSGLLGNSGFEVVNHDDAAWRVLPGRNGRRISFGLLAGADVRATEVQLTNSGSLFQLLTPWGESTVRLPLLGDYNIANALGAAAAVLALGQPLGEVVERLAESPQVPGRMELIADRPVVLRDYAHTPDALERALATLRPLTPARLIVVFGCGGDRDRGKRPLMGRIATEWADLPIVTSDNPRTEDPDLIIDEIEQGMGGSAHHRFTDRRAAIQAALSEARDGDTILLAGKGHETYQVVGREKLPFDEREIVLAALQ